MLKPLVHFCYNTKHNRIMDKKWVTAARDGVNKSYRPFPQFLGESALRIYHSVRMNRELLSPTF